MSPAILIAGGCKIRRVTFALATALCATAAASAGCTGHAGISLIPLQMKDLNPAHPLVHRFSPSECYYRLDDGGKIHLAMRYQNLPWFGPFSSVTITLSLALDELPAGRARTYPLRGNNLRLRAAVGPKLHRMRSTYGIATIHNVQQHSLRGRFRCYARHQSGSVLTGWRGDSPLLLTGEFLAVENEDLARELEGQAETGNWTRQPRPDAATPPSSQPSKTSLTPIPHPADSKQRR